MRLGVIGSGHVGLVSSVCFAAIGHHVIATDADREKIDQLREGTAPFYEPGLQEMLEAQLASGHLGFSYDLPDSISGMDAIFICVGTPPAAGGEASLEAVERSARAIAQHADGNHVVVEKATVPTGTARRMRTLLQRQRPDLDMEVVSNPEFLREGNAVEDAMSPPRILVGAESPHAFTTMREIYQPLVDRGAPYIETDIQSAELAKYAANAFLALKISYANALARLCERIDADVIEVAEVVGSDPRIGKDFLRAGIGYGGSCFPKDLMAFERFASKVGYAMPFLGEIAKVNREAVDALLEKVEEALWNLPGKRVALLGLAFKPETDDVRFAPALTVAAALLQAGCHVVAYDPRAMQNAKAEIDDLELAENPYEAASGTDAVVICTEWEEFSRLDLVELKNVMNDPVVIDGRNVFTRERMAEAGFRYFPTGRMKIA